MRPPARTGPGLLALAVLATTLSACGSGSTPPASAVAGPAPDVVGAGAAVVDSAVLPQLRSRVLVDDRGYALYLYVPDHRRAVTCAAACAVTWPPLRTAAGATIRAGAGVRADLLGSDPDPTGGRVVTYDHWPLYTYADDLQPGFATGQGLDIDGGYWYLVQPDGAPLTRSS